jgi:hypothetical protein
VALGLKRALRVGERITRIIAYNLVYLFTPGYCMPLSHCPELAIWLHYPEISEASPTGNGYFVQLPFNRFASNGKSGKAPRSKSGKSAANAIFVMAHNDTEENWRMKTNRVFFHLQFSKEIAFSCTFPEAMVQRAVTN